MSNYFSEAFIEDFETAVANLVTEDDEPVDNIFSEKQQRLLVDALVNSWQPRNPETNERRTFLAASNVGIFSSVQLPPIVPDAFISMDLDLPQSWDFSQHRAYFIWDFDKSPEVVVEIVSNRKGGEMKAKMTRYAKLGIGYYIVFDPFQVLSKEPLKVHELIFGGRRYGLRPDFHLPEIDLSVTLWRGEYEGFVETWLRWCDAEGNLILTGGERITLEAERADLEKGRADYEQERADDAAKRADEAVKRADDEAKRADEAEAKNAKLRAELEKLQGKQK